MPSPRFGTLEGEVRSGASGAITSAVPNLGAFVRGFAPALALITRDDAVMQLRGSNPTRSVELPEPPELTREEIAATAAAFCENLRQTPANADRTLWRDLGRNEIRLSYPLPLELICDFHRIGLVFVEALRRIVPDIFPAFAKLTAEFGKEPSIYVDENRREFVLFGPERSGGLTRFFIAAQVGHLLLHLRPPPIGDEPGGFFVAPNISENCRRQASAFARALLMPRAEFEAEFEKVRKTPTRLASLSLRFSAPRWAVEARLKELGHAAARERASTAPA